MPTKNKPTDVLSFRLWDAKDIKTKLLGEIFINYEYVTIQSKKHRANFVSEFVLLFIHGLLHLIGYDHFDAKTKTQMFSAQNKIMKKLNLIK